MALPPTDRNYRLPRSIRPVRYDAFLSLDLERGAFTGKIRISLSIEREAAWIALHAAGLEVTRATVLVGGTALEGKVDLFEASETIVLTTGDTIPVGRTELELTWMGTFSTGLRGLYRAGPLVATQFEAADARRVFPCLDEPGFKAPWAVAIEVPRGIAVLGNGREVRREARGDRDVVTFSETPPLPTYLVALVAGPMSACAEERVRGVPVRTWAIPEKADLTAFGQ
jgi:puromycin-sensitive aminopeptidase